MKFEEMKRLGEVDLFDSQGYARLRLCDDVQEALRKSLAVVEAARLVAKSRYLGNEMMNDPYPGLCAALAELEAE